MKVVGVFPPGGMRGWVSAALFQAACATNPLRAIGDERGAYLAKRPSKGLDLIVGTSTGALIATAIERDMPPREITDIYRTEGRQIFRIPFLRKLWTLNGLIGPKYDRKYLAGILNRITMNPSSGVRMMKPSFRRPDGARIDGGVYSGSGALIGYVEAKKLWPDHQIIVVIFGNEPVGGGEITLAKSWKVHQSRFQAETDALASAAAPTFFDPVGGGRFEGIIKIGAAIDAMLHGTAYAHDYVIEKLIGETVGGGIIGGDDLVISMRPDKLAPSMKIGHGDMNRIEAIATEAVALNGQDIARAATALYMPQCERGADLVMRDAPDLTERTSLLRTFVHGPDASHVAIDDQGQWLTIAAGWRGGLVPTRRA